MVGLEVADLPVPSGPDLECPPPFLPSTLGLWMALSKDRRRGGNEDVLRESILDRGSCQCKGPEEQEGRPIWLERMNEG